MKFDKHMTSKSHPIETGGKVFNYLCGLNVKKYTQQILLYFIKQLLETGEKTKCGICIKKLSYG